MTGRNSVHCHSSSVETIQVSEALIESTPAASDKADSRRPAFRLQQLFVLMAVMAVMLAVSGRSELPGLENSSLVRLAFASSRVIFTLFGSIAVTIVGYGVWRHKQGQRFFDEPGHWLLVAIAVQQVLLLCELLLLEAVAAIEGVNRTAAARQIPFGLTFLVPTAVLVILNVYIARKKCSEARWRKVFYANAVANVVPILGHMLLLVCLERAIRAERDRRAISSRWVRARGVQPIAEGQVVTTPRDFIHWCGVAITFAEAGMMVLFVILLVCYLVILASS